MFIQSSKYLSFFAIATHEIIVLEVAQSRVSRREPPQSPRRARAEINKNNAIYINENIELLTL